MFSIKICGIKSLKDAQAALDAGVDAIGLNFYEQSPRYVTIELARQICNIIPPTVTPVGVFVNAPTDKIKQICYEVGIEVVQLHGDEPPEHLTAIKPRWKVIRACRMDDRGLQGLGDDLQACSDNGGLFPDAVLLDAAVAGQYGGTGSTLAWNELADWRPLPGAVPLILAGGLTPENVTEAISAVRPDGVDVASGVESAPGVKDPEKMRLFVEAAKTAFAKIT